MSDITLDEFRKKGQDARKASITTEQLREWGKKSAKKRLQGMSKEEKSEYFKKVRSGLKVS